MVAGQFLSGSRSCSRTEAAYRKRPVFRRQATAGKSGVPRSVDYFVNSGANVALDVVNFALARSDDIRASGRPGSFQGLGSSWGPGCKGVLRPGHIFAECGGALRVVNDSATQILTSVGTHVTQDIEEARRVIVDSSAQGGAPNLFEKILRKGAAVLASPRSA